MKRAPVYCAAFIFAAVVSLCGAARAFAQDVPPQEAPPQDTPSQQTPTQPKPAGRDYQPFGDDPNSDVQSPDALRPDTTPLTGVLVPGVGSPEMRHSYWVPGFQYGNFIRSNGLNQAVGTGFDWNSTSFVAGNVSVFEAWNHAQLTANYSGGGTFSTDPAQGNSFFHQLAVVQAFNWRRIQMSFIDQFTYLPQSQFGFGAGTGLATPGVGGSLGPSLPGLQTNYQPNQTIFTSLGSRYSNSITGQVVYDVSPRSSVTFTGSYGILRFLQPGSIDSNDSILAAGYNYAVSKKDTIGLEYNFIRYEYPGNPQSIDNHVVELAYGRKVTGRLALQFFVGPEITEFAVPLNGSSGSLSVAGGANLNYALQHMGVSLGYSHGVAGGSGAFAGSKADMVQGSLNRQLSRVWHGNVSFGYARNSSLTNGSAALPSPTFNSYFAGAGVDRPLGRTASLSIAYTAYIQGLSETACGTGSCATSLQNQISLNFQWHTHPFVLR